ncbi:MAG: DUF4835 family protein [Saprospiraceae bacterium]|nr:DUF4835 family protein [Saprospiraceae bacterium]
MKWWTKSVFLFLLMALTFNGKGQELNCEVIVTTENIQVTDPTVFEDLQQKVFEFMNNTKWTRDKFEPQEKIDCSIYINILNEIALNEFSATATIKSSRPVYNSSYQTVLLDVIDKDFQFTYDPFTIFEYRSTEFANNLTSSLAFYAYTIIGLDYDSFQRNGGARYHKKAQEIVNTATSVNYSGWTANTTNNRGNLSKYWLNENLTNPKYRNFNLAIYDYHRNGLDRMYDNPNTAWRGVMNSLKKVQSVNKETRNLPIVFSFFEAKSDEIVGVFSKASPKMKTDVYNIVTEVDVTHTKTYKQLQR